MDTPTIVACLSGEAADEERRRLAEWRAADPENEQEFQRMVRLWELLGDSDWVQEEAPIPPARDVIARADTRSEAEVAQPTPVTPARTSASDTTRTSRASRWTVPRGVRGGGIAAAIAAGLVLGLLLPEGDQGPQAHAEIVTGAGEVATVVLGDGTVARIAPQSRLEFPATGDSRTVDLDGRAYFAVSERTDVPFRVRVPDGEIEVLGTRFEVDGTEASVQVAVVEGNVRFETRGYEVGLGANEVGRTTGGSPPEVEAVEDVFQVINWLGSFLAFESTPMRQVAEEFERRFDVRMEFADSALVGTRVTGSFTDQSPEEMIAGVCTAISAQCAVRDGVVWVE